MSESRQPRVCSGCGSSLNDHSAGVELWNSWFCTACFIGNATRLHRELTPDDVALMRTIGRELAGFLPPDLLEMVLVGFYKRASGQKDPPAPLEIARCVGEIQRLTAFACFRQILNLLKTWQGSFTEFVEQQESEIRDKIKRLTDLDA